ncbi:MAG: sulfite exporter TauE/SafE family protein [Hydrogenophilales bacterium]|nr:sulfite exporter TauE/SafE family protein [Hydrogenophilales bacterium]
MSVSIAQMGLSFTAGGLTTLSPCVFPILPLVVGGAMQANRLAPVAMGAGMVASFALMGVLVGALGEALGIDTDTIRVAGALLLIAFGVVMLVPALNNRFTLLITPLSSMANQASSRVDGGSLIGAFALGALLGMVWSPCSGPLLASALTLVATKGNAPDGALILGLFGLGAAVPLVAIAYATRAGFTRSRDWVLGHIGALKTGFAVLLVLVGVAILFGGDKWLEALVTQSLPDAWVNITTRF